MQTVIETSGFEKRSAKLLTEAERLEMVGQIASDPLAGDIMAGTGGFRKIRVARQGEGKSGGFRVVYYFHCEDCPIYLVDIFAKNEKSNLTKEEQNMLAKLAAILKQAHGK